MLRILAAVLAFGGLLNAPAAAQRPKVGLSVQLGPDTFPRGVRYARVQLRSLFADPDWANALDQSFPIRLTYRMEIWRSRDGWIDEFQRATEWSTVIQYEPLQDQYRVTELLLSGPVETRFQTRDELARWIGITREVDALPVGAGSFYYDVKLRISALSDEDMEEIEQFLSGGQATPARPERSSIGRSFRRFLLRLAGLPGEELTVRTERFRVR
ncbi:MAG TPA: DUF4390 domain-containing protein [Gemmatimonadales bacterium]|nr:DUF4390 domain-containing protein [Gemmatimonadales bacterium]